MQIFPNDFLIFLQIFFMFKTPIAHVHPDGCMA